MTLKNKGELQRPALKLGAGQYIKKPFTIQKFAIALKKELKAKT
jgi:response regulator of citrate/malate metabolism